MITTKINLDVLTIQKLAFLRESGITIDGASMANATDEDLIKYSIDAAYKEILDLQNESREWDSLAPMDRLPAFKFPETKSLERP